MNSRIHYMYVGEIGYEFWTNFWSKEWDEYCSKNDVQVDIPEVKLKNNAAHEAMKNVFIS